MNVKELIARLEMLDVQIHADGGRLKLNAPEGVLTEELRREISNAKDGILALLAASGGNGHGQAKAEYTPLSSAQRRLWFLQKLEGSNAAYNMSAAFHLRGRLDEQSLSRALREIIRRHGSLRTVFAVNDGEPYQRILADVYEPVTVVDITHLSEAEREAAALKLISEAAEIPFDLAGGPLFKSLLIRAGVEVNYLLISMSHIVTDGLSNSVFIKELEALYREFTGGASASLPALTAQYTDYAAMEHSALVSGKLNSKIDYWRAKLNGAALSLDIPTDSPRVSSPNYQGASREFNVNAGILSKLKDASRQAGATLFMTLASAYAVLLSRYCRQDDVILGVPVGNRNNPDFEELIGFFTNTLPLRIQLGGNPTFAELLKQTRQSSIELVENGDVPFESIVSAVNPERDMSRAPIVQTMFALHNIARHGQFPPLILDGVDALPVNAGNTYSRFDIETNIWETKSGLSGLLVYASSIFSDGMMERFSGNYTRLLEAIAENPNRRVNEYPTLTDGEITLYKNINCTKNAFPENKCLNELFEEQVSSTPNAIAAIHDGERLTYAELSRRANAIAARLGNAGAGVGDKVGLYVNRGLGMLAGLMGILKSGAAYVPLDPSYPNDRIAFMLMDCGAKAVITEHGLENSLPKGNFKLITTGVEELDSIPTSPVAVTDDPANSLAYIIYTSGSTGKPKGVAITHRSIVNFLWTMREKPGISPDDVMLAVTTISFDIAGLELFLPLICGAAVVIADRLEASDGKSIARLMEQHGVTIAQATPATWRMLLESGWAGRPNLKALCGGEALPKELSKKLIGKTAALWNMYGPTETTVWSSVYKASESIDGIGAAEPVGRPIANTTMHILNDSMTPVPVGAVGELYIGGAGVSPGYLGRPELNIEKFVADPFSNEVGARLYRTGDHARILPDGDIEFLGRSDFQIKLRGYRIELGEIESVILSLAGVAECAAIVREDSPGDKRLSAYVTPKSAEAFEKEIRELVKVKLPDYMAPAVYVFMDRLPQTPNGKIDRKSLPAPLASRVASASFTPPATEKEAILSGVWAKLLGSEKVGVMENIFDMGAHSFLVIKAQAELENRHGIKIDAIDMFRYPTVRSLAARISDTPALENNNRAATLAFASAARESMARQKAAMMKRKGL